MREIQGDLLALADTGMFDVIAHGCNCFCTMGAGIAKQIARQYPEALEADKSTTKAHRGKLGTYTLARVTTPSGYPLTIANLYTQYNWGGEHSLEYDALSRAVRTLGRLYVGKRVGLPWIGCGLAGGDREKVLDILDRLLDPMVDLTVVEYVPGA